MLLRGWNHDGRMKDGLTSGCVNIYKDVGSIQVKLTLGMAYRRATGDNSGGKQGLPGQCAWTMRAAGLWPTVGAESSQLGDDVSCPFSSLSWV